MTTVMMPDGHDADRLRAIILERFNMSLGAGLGRFKGRAFRIGHLGDFNDLMLMGTLCGVEMGLALAGIPSSPGGVDAAMKSATYVLGATRTCSGALRRAARGTSSSPEHGETRRRS